MITLSIKVKVEGIENLEKAGQRALIIPNHMSYMDVLLISAFVDREITFSVSDQYCDVGNGIVNKYCFTPLLCDVIGFFFCINSCRHRYLI